MRAFAQWVSDRRHRSVLAAALLGLLSPLVGLFAPLAVPSAAVIVLADLRYGAREALLIAVSATLVLAGARTLLGGGAAIALALSVGLWLPALGVAELLRRSQSLSLCLQTSVLGVGALVLTLFAVGDPVGQIRALLESMRGELEASFQMQLSTDMLTSLAQGFTAAAFGGTLLTIVASLLLGRWWEQLCRGEGRFGAEFRGLCMGRVLAVAAALLIVAYLLTRTVVLESLLCVLGVGFVLQGLAVLHSAAVAQDLHVGWLAALYVALFATAFYAAVVIGLVGWLDTWFDLRGRLQRRVERD
jgi:hypothetical protein